jgi:hypothetical protein
MDEFDEGSDVDNWETEQVFQDQCYEGEGDFFDSLNEFEEFADEYGD